MGFAGLHILTLESRRADLVRKLVSEHGGECFNAPSVRERPLGTNPQAMQFARELIAGEYDMVIFTTGAGARYLLDVIAASGLLEAFVEALRRVRIVSRGPKPAAVLNEWKVPVAVHVPEPNTWREVLDVTADVPARRVAVQEYGSPNPELIHLLRQRGLVVTPVTIYRWDLPEDAAPLEEAVRRICERWCDIAIFLSSVQLANLLRVAERAGSREAAISALQSHIVVVSIGPVMSDALMREGLRPDFEPKHPKLGVCIRQLAERAKDLVSAKSGAAGR
jgi:uroporphyrinogen-III synthase